MSQLDGENKDEVCILVVGAKQETLIAFDELVSHKKDSIAVDYARTGIEGVTKSKFLNPDIVFVASSTPDMGHTELVAALKKSVPDTRIVLMSGSNDPSWIRRGLLAGGDNYLSEPPNLDGLLHTINVTLTKR